MMPALGQRRQSESGNKAQTVVASDPDRPLFRGFVGGEYFMTKKGYRGFRLDTLWSKQIIDALENDDEQLVEIALKSSLADLDHVVVGGEYGSAFRIADFGFYAQNQFDKQAKILQSIERETSKSIHFLSEGEWQRVDQNLYRLADGMNGGQARFRRACRGDTFAALAIRKSAFHCAKIMMREDADPLKQNEDGEDLFKVLEIQYGVLADDLRKLQEERVDASQRVLKPSEQRMLAEREAHVVENLEKMIVFVLSSIEYLQRRQVAIEKDMWTKRRADLRREEVSSEILWNVNQYDKVKNYIKELTDLIEQSKLILKVNERHAKEHVNLADVVKNQHQEILAKKETPLLLDRSTSAVGGRLVR